MRKSKFTEGQIIEIVNEHLDGKSVADICDEYSISIATFYIWNARYKNETTNKIKRIKDLKLENQRLKEVILSLTLENDSLKKLLAQKGHFEFREKERK